MKHNFIESSANGSLYNKNIYCTWCGKVVWNFNDSSTSITELQKDIKDPCVYTEKPTKQKEQN